MKSGSTIPDTTAPAAHSPPWERWSGPFADEEGMDIQDGIRHYPQAKLVYTAPSHQFPLSGTLSLPEGSPYWNGRKPIGRGYLKTITIANSAMPPALCRRCRG